MAMYTMELREYIEMWSQDTIDTMSQADIIEAGRVKLFDFDYPIYDTNYKQDFETHFIRQFYMREIGFETEGLFKFYLETWLLVNMPYWNKMFESELLVYDPLQNSNATSSNTATKDRTQNDTRNSSGTSSTNGTVTDDDFERFLNSDTPDGRLGLTATDGTGVIEYASNIQEHNQNNSQTSTGNSTGNVTDTLASTISDNETVSTTRSGKIGVQTYAEMIQKHRDIFLRIEKDIFKEMSRDLFMLVY